MTAVARSTTCSFALLLALGSIACQGEISGMGGDIGDLEALEAADDSVTDVMYSGTFSVGKYVQVCNCSALNQRSGPGTSYSILRAMPAGSTVKVLATSGNWYKNDWGSRVGWSSGTYLCATSSSSSSSSAGSLSAPLSRDGIIQVAGAAVGFSYWWGGAKFAAGGSHGSCYGDCPDCSHSGSYGADCSGFVSKAWMLPEAMPIDSNLHPYSTYSFYHNSTHWSDVSRSSIVRADAMVYRGSSGGHVFLYESGDGWGSMWTYEARGCSYGVVHNVRTAGSSYKGIRRDSL